MTPFLTRLHLGAIQGVKFFLLTQASVLALLATTTQGQPAGTIKDVRVGFAGAYKVGHWTPVWVDVVGASTLADGRVEITVNDSDGVPATVSAPVTNASPGEPATFELAMQAGRMGSTIHIALRNEGGEIDRRAVPSDPAEHKEWALVDLPATSELVVSFGPLPFGLEAAFPPRDSKEGGARRAIRLDRVAQLPSTWFGYEAVDVLVLSVGDGALCRELAADTVRMNALREWVELGGRIVILCGGDVAEKVLAEGQPLAALVPGKVVGVTSLEQTGPLEHFSESSVQIGGTSARVTLKVPKLAEVNGRIEAYAGHQPGDLPLVVRGPLGLGEVAFAGVDVSAPPLADWPGRTAFLHALLRPYRAKDDSTSASRTLMTLGYNDVSGALRQRLGRSFANVTTVGFPMMALLALGYLVLLGPVDYWFVHKVLRRPEAAWITFAAVVLGTGVGAFALAGWSRGPSTASANQIQLVDFDVAAGRARGTHWSVLHSPEARRFDLSLSSAQDTAETTLLACWGLTGVGIGGMDSRNVDRGLIADGYRIAPALDSLKGVPLLPNSTKSFLGRWTGPAQPLIEAKLVDQDELPAGTVTNRSGGPLGNVQLMYGAWAYRLGNLADGATFEVGQHLDAIQVRTMVARNAGIAAEQLSGQQERSVFLSDRASADELLNLMMFYDAAGGQAFAQLPSRFQAYCDLSRLLELGRAIVVAEAPGPGRELCDGGQPLAAGGEPRVVYRFVLPVEKGH